MNNDKILEKVKMKIAISNSIKEDIYMKKSKVKRSIGIAACTIMALASVSFAASKVIETIWKNPEKIQNITSKITEESKKENISEEEAKQIAIDKLNEIAFNANIVETDHYKEIDSDKIIYRFKTEDNYLMEVDGFTGKFCRLSNYNENIQDLNLEITEEEAIKAADKYYQLFKLKEEGYEYVDIYTTVSNEGSGKGPGSTFQITYMKKYGDIYNPYEEVTIVIQSKNKALDRISITDIPFENNEIIITEEEAIKIALEVDSKIETNKVVETKAKKMIVKMNANAYDRINNKEEFYESRQTANYPLENRNYYNVEDRVRNAWVVVIKYEDNYGDDMVKRYTEGQYSYFVDCTTGEIIGGNTMDYIYNN